MSTLREELQAIYDRRHVLTPAVVVDEARDPNHVLHSRFEWNDSAAGEKWRQEQARTLIRSVRVVYRQADETRGEGSVRAFHAVRNEDGYAFKPHTEVIADPMLTKIVLADMEREWRALYSRYKQFAEFVDIVRRDLDDPDD